MRSKNLCEQEIEKLFSRKRLFHHEMANLPFEEKIEILVRLQKMDKDIQKIIGKQQTEKRKIWRITLPTK